MSPVWIPVMYDVITVDTGIPWLWPKMTCIHLMSSTWYIIFMCDWGTLHNVSAARCCSCSWNAEQRSLHLHSESIDQWAGDTTSSPYRFISWDHGVPAAFPSLPKALLNAATSVSWMLKKRGKSLPNCVVSHVFRVQPTSPCPTLSLTIQPTGGGLRVEAGSCPRCWTWVPRRRRKKKDALPHKASCLSWRDDRESEGGARNTAAVDVPSKRAAHRSHVCHHKPRVDYCTERLYNSEVGCCTCNITRWVARLFWFIFIFIED